MALSATVPLTRNWTRIDGVDCLRALAIFYVLMNHVNMRLLFARVPYTLGVPRQLVTALVWQGQAGVQIFFAVSGFLITSTTLKRWGTPAGLRPRDFYVMRFARIAPLMFALLAVLCLLHTLHFGNFIVSPAVGGLGGALYAALTFHVGLLEATKGYLPANWDILWSLGVEEVFYLGFPLAGRLLGRGKGLVSLLVLFVALGPFARTILTHGNPVWREYSYLGGMDAIAMGCLTALLLSRRPLARKVILLLAGCGAGLLAFCLCCASQMERMGLEKTGLSMSLLGAGTCMVIAVAAQTRWRAARSMTPLLVLGRRSYEIYLTHMFVVFALFDVFVWMGKPLWLVPLLFIAVIAVSGALGELVARFYSELANRWLRDRFEDGPGTLGSVIQTD